MKLIDQTYEITPLEHLREHPRNPNQGSDLLELFKGTPEEAKRGMKVLKAAQ